MYTEIAKPKLLKILIENRERHRRAFAAALDGWREEAEKQLSETLGALRAGKRPQIRLHLPVPEDHTRDYNRQITMTELHAGETLKLSESDAAKFVMDDWDWKRQWLLSNSAYASAAIQEEYAEEIGS